MILKKGCQNSKSLSLTNFSICDFDFMFGRHRGWLSGWWGNGMSAADTHTVFCYLCDSLNSFQLAAGLLLTTLNVVHFPNDELREYPFINCPHVLLCYVPMATPIHDDFSKTKRDELIFSIFWLFGDIQPVMIQLRLVENQHGKIYLKYHLIK